MKEKKNLIKIYTDGSCLKNGDGGFGVVIIDTGKYFLDYYHKHSDNTTNNREELKAILFALDYIYSHGRPCVEHYQILSDSSYCVNMINEWIYTWVKNDWKRSKNQEIENLDLVKQIYNYLKEPNFDFWEIGYVKGHNNIFGNELADALATNNENKIASLKEKWFKKGYCCLI